MDDQGSIMGVVTLTTDFGTTDEYVGVIKGVILRIYSSVTLVDISHQVAPQAVAEGGQLLGSAFGWFPQGTVHMAVVDPGVGSERAIVAACHSGHTFVAPDNGLLPIAWAESPPDAIVHVQNSRLFLHPVSNTFHGRDIMAPVTAHLAAGMDVHELGPAVAFAQLQRIAMTSPEVDASEVIGRIVGADHFGNLRTNIDVDLLHRLQRHHPGAAMAIMFGPFRILGLSTSYSQALPDCWVALIGSRNRLELALNCASAAERLPEFKGMPVRVVMQT
jgi:S-adenosylmethionine hydrolase